MPSARKHRRGKKAAARLRTGRVSRQIASKLKVGDTVMVLGGGNSQKNRNFRGKVGKIIRVLPKTCRVVVEGINMITQHKRARSATQKSGRIEKEGSIHISNVMYYSEDLKRPVRIRVQTQENGTRVRGFMNPKTKKFESIDA